MRTIRIWITLCCCAIALTALAQAPKKPKPGLYESTTTTSFGGQSMPAMPQMPAGMKMPAGGPMGGPHVTQVCLTQAMIDKYGGPFSKPPRGDCQVSNMSLNADGMTANITCTGDFSGTGTVATTFIDSSSTETKVHMTGTMQMSGNSRPVDITMDSKSVYKGPDCGNVKPIQMPADK